ncbi:MAG: LptF/LptG family permease [Armatimonadetes bacterium]|nr:LptF/LptG family permease [Armatimonadota bacterium]
MSGPCTGVGSDCGMVIMRRLDRYVLTEMLPPFVFGVGAFLAVLIGVTALSQMLILIFRQGFPVASAVQVFLLKLPGVVTMTLPMATMFASLMAMSRLSGDGELVALRSGGVSIPRIGVSVIVMGFVVSVFALAVNELMVPRFNDRAFHIMRAAYSTTAADNDMAFEVRGPDGKLQRWLYGKSFDPETMTLENATIADFTHGEVNWYTARRVRWQGETWILENGEHTWWRDGESNRVHVDRLAVNVGRSADEMLRVRKRPEDMSLSEARGQARLEIERGDMARAGRLLQHIQVRLAAPWSSLGFAILGLPLGVRRLRTSRGIGMGLSLVVIFAYYVLMNMLSVMGERTMGHHTLIAWTPNLLLYLVGIGLLLRSSQ